MIVSLLMVCLWAGLFFFLSLLRLVSISVRQEGECLFTNLMFSCPYLSLALQIQDEHTAYVRNIRLRDLFLFVGLGPVADSYGPHSRFLAGAGLLARSLCAGGAIRLGRRNGMY